MSARTARHKEAGFGRRRQTRRRSSQPATEANRTYMGYPNTSSATSTRPNGALTCTPCTVPFTC